MIRYLHERGDSDLASLWAVNYIKTVQAVRSGSDVDGRHWQSLSRPGEGGKSVQGRLMGEVDREGPSKHGP